MTFSSDDLVPLFNTPQPTMGMGFRQGVILEWNPLTAENKVDIGGAAITNLTVFNTSEIKVLKPGDIVGVAVVGGSPKTYGILGRMLIPGTADAAKIIDTVQGGSIVSGFVQADANFTGEQATPADLPGSFGPQIFPTVGPSGRLLVIGSAKIDSSNGVNAQMFAQINTQPVTFQHLMATSALIQTDANDLTIGSAAVREYSGLTPGPVTITAKYVAEFAAPGVPTYFSARALVAIPL